MEADGKVHEGKEEGARCECSLPWGNDAGAGSWQMCGILLRENSRWKKKRLTWSLRGKSFGQPGVDSVGEWWALRQGGLGRARL